MELSRPPGKFAGGPGLTMSETRHRKKPLEECLTLEAVRLKEAAKRLKPGKRRHEMFRKARDAEVTACISIWITSPGLPPSE